MIGGDKQHTQDRGNSVSATSQLSSLSLGVISMFSSEAHANTVDIRAPELTNLSHINITSLATNAHFSFFLLQYTDLFPIML